MSRVLSGIIPDEAVFADFRRQALSTDNWYSKYDKNGMEVWVEVAPVTSPQGNKNVPKVHKIKCRMTIKDVSAATMYDVLHDGQYRRKWDPTMLESFDIARLSPNADMGYYSWLCPKPLKNRDVVTLRSWQVTDDEYVIINCSVKHPKYPPKKDLVRAISLLTGYLVKALGPNSCSFTYLSQADPKGSLPKWVVNKASQVLAPRVLKCVHKAGQSYPDWKKQNSPAQKPWLYPEQSILPIMDPSELTIQRADSLENVDESTQLDIQEGDKTEDSS
ncbi:START domain-containing protein 10 [Oncorhynchus mykiss]|uniref:START domain-containing protein 10 n=1 Tax=Oncorhynchus mykiss TaxID=8022 RepID=A0A8C7VRP9_ONCMY|nr:START domain-containing protein 10 [Oncorhynchus mykiss]